MHLLLASSESGGGMILVATHRFVIDTAMMRRQQLKGENRGDRRRDGLFVSSSVCFCQCVSSCSLPCLPFEQIIFKIRKSARGIENW